MGFVFGPSWFYGMDTSFGIVATLVTFLIAVYSFRVFLLTRLRRYMYISLAFLFLCGSYVIKAIADYMVFNHLTRRIPNVIETVSKVVEMPVLFNLGLLVYIFLSLAGFLILVAVYMRIQSIRVLTLLFLLVIVLAFLSQSTFVAFHITLFIMLLFIVLHLLSNHIQKNRLNTFFTLFSFACIFIAQVFFVLLSIDPVYYVVGQCLQLFGFILLLINMIIVLRK